MYVNALICQQQLSPQRATFGQPLLPLLPLLPLPLPLPLLLPPPSPSLLAATENKRAKMIGYDRGCLLQLQFKMIRQFWFKMIANAGPKR